MTLDPTIVSWLLIGGAAFCAFMIGRNSVRPTEMVIEDTILYLIHNGFLRARKSEKGEWDIIPLDEK